MRLKLHKSPILQELLKVLFKVKIYVKDQFDIVQITVQR